MRSVLAEAVIVSALVLGCSPSAAAQAEAVPARITKVVDEGHLVTLRGHTHPLARPQYDQGAAPDNQPMRRMLLLLQHSPEQETALQKLLDEQQIKSSPNYHKWLTPEDFGKQFGPAESDIQAVTDWLTSQGFEVNRVAAGRTVIEFSGTAGLVRQALHTEIHKFAVEGKEYWANSSDPEIPAALAPVVAGFPSLNNFPREPQYRRLGTFSRSKLTGQVTPEFTFNVTSGTYYGIGPTDFATIYNVLPLWQSGTDGTGQTVAIVGETNIKIQDIRNFRSLFGLPANDPQIILDGPDPGITDVGEEAEADLDVEWSGAVARNATIDLVVSASTESTAGVDLSMLYIVDNNLAPVMSESYGICEVELGVGGNIFESAVRQQAAAQGITVINSGGDHGSARCDPSTYGQLSATHGLAVSGLASTPYEVAIGGTDFDDVGTGSTYWNATNASLSQSSAKSYIPETTWNDSCATAGLNGCNSGPSGTGADLVAGGGGPSTCGIMTGKDNGTCVGGYPKPTWQTEAGVPNDGVRDIPDVALFAADGRNRNFYIFCESDFNQGSNSSCDLNSPYTNFEAGGGTSFAAPAFAGIMALVNQKTGQRQGNANYVLYPLAAQSGASCASNSAAVNNSACIFYDTVRGNNSVVCRVNSPNCGGPTGLSWGVLVDPNNPSTPAWTTTAGYDLATGLGSVNAANLVNKWSSVSFTPTTTTLSLSPATLTHGQPVNVTANVTAGSGTPTGSVSLFGPAGGLNNSPAGIASFQLTGGTFSGTTTLLPGGTYNVTGHYAGDGTFGASDSTPPVQLTVTKENSQTQLGLVTFDINSGAVANPNTTTAVYGSPYIMRVNVSNSAGTTCPPGLPLTITCPGGNVALTDGGNTLDAGTFVLNSQGYTEDLPIQLNGGTHSVQAQYSGDRSYNASTGSASIIITPAPTQTDGPNVVGDVATVNVPFTLSTTVRTQNFGPAPTGTVAFFIDGAQVTGTVALTPTPGSPPPYGHYSYLQASIAATVSTSGFHTVSATYSGDSNYATSNSPGPPIDVRYVPTITLSVTPTIVIAGTSVTETALIDTTNKNLPPTGHVFFYGGGFTGDVPVAPTKDPSGNSAAQAIQTYTPAVPGNWLTAMYYGDVNYSATQWSNGVSVVVFPAGTGSDFMLQDQNSPIPISAPGQSASTAISIIPTPGTNATVAVTCSVPATMAEATCSLSPNSVTLTDQKISTSQLTVTTTASHTVANLWEGPNWFGGGGAILACLLLLCVPALRRRPSLFVVVLLMALLTTGSSSCGGGSSSGGGGGGGGPITDPGTLPGDYSINVTATSTIGGTSVTHTIAQTFRVQ